MGEVYEVDHTRTGTRRAVKVARPLLLATDGILAHRLLREGRVLRSIEHPNVVRVFEAGKLSDGRPYFAMELLEGTTLRQVVAEQAPMSWSLAIRMTVQALDGLQAIHDRGIVHRDVKPGNLFVDGWGIVKVLDLGIAKLTDPHGSGPRTREGMVMGTTRYMAPEQLSGGEVDPRADLYSLGLVLLELLVGRVLSRRKVLGDEVFALVRRHGPEELEVVLRRALSVDPAERPSSAAQMAAELRAFVSVPVVPPRPKARGPFAPVIRSEPTGTLSVPMSFVGSRRKPPWFWGVQIGIVVISLFAIVVATGVTWMVASQSGLEDGRCSTGALGSSVALPAVHVGDGAGGR
jgi:serine/threonine-protein kinase